MDWVNIALVLQSFALLWAWARIRHLDHALRGQSLEMGAVRERVGVSDYDVDGYHSRIHPECRPEHLKGGR